MASISQHVDCHIDIYADMVVYLLMLVNKMLSC